MIGKILIVEDEPKLAAVLADYLKASGFEASLLANGMEVVTWVREHKPDLVLLDVMLPGRDGMDICKEVRTFSHVPVIMITARVEEIDRLLGLEFGADDYICKPFSPREVVARVKAVLRRTHDGKSIRYRGSFLMNTAIGRRFMAMIWNLRPSNLSCCISSSSIQAVFTDVSRSWKQSITTTAL